MTFLFASPMAEVDIEEQQYQADVQAVKQWWKDSRWRYTKRPYTAEEIVAKRGNLKWEYPSNVQSKKLWRVFEERYRVRDEKVNALLFTHISLEQRCEYHFRMYGTYRSNSDGEVS